MPYRIQQVAFARWSLSSLMLVLTSQLAAAADKPMPRVPEGYSLEVAAGTELVRHPIMAGFDDRGRLYVAETAGLNLPAAELKEKLPNFVRRLEDTDGDGRFDKSTIFADKMTFPQGALWHRGALYVASSGAIWKLEDTDDDGVADRRTNLVNEFGFTGNAADVHGCFLGPEGRLYWCEGRHGHEIRDSKGNLISKGKAARIFSSRLDGSDLQVFCGGGMDNPVEIDFLPTGEMVGTVNIMLHPRGDCLVHWMRGGVYPHDDASPIYVAEFKRTGDLLGPIHDFGHVAVSGMTRYRSTHFGDDFQDNVFVTLFNTHKVVRCQLERQGSTFAMKSVTDFFVSDDPDSHPTDVIEDADGSLLVIDTGGWFRIGCPTSQVAKPEIAGAIYRIRRKNAPPVQDPRGLKIEFASRSPEELVGLLSDPRHVVRAKATDRLAQMGEPAAKALTRALASKEHAEVTRRHAVWALSQIPEAVAVNGLRAALADSAESVRLAGLRGIGHRLAEFGTPADAERLKAMATGDTPAVRREAATALGHAGTRWLSARGDSRPVAIASLFDSLRAGVPDRQLEHAVLYALIEIADREQTRRYLNDPSPTIRRAALIALDQMDDGQLTREEVTALLDTDDPALQKTALDVISRRSGWAAETLALLQEWLEAKELPAERATVLRGFLLAQAADPKLQQSVADWLTADRLQLPQRLLLLEVVQRVGLEQLPERWIAALGASIQSPSVDVRQQAIRIVTERKIRAFDPPLNRLAEDEQQPAELRVEAMLAVAGRSDAVANDRFRFLTGRLTEEVPPLSRLTAARALAELPLSQPQLLELTARFDDAGPLAMPVLLRAYSRKPTADTGLALVRALEKSKSARGLSPDELASMLRTFPESVRNAAAPLLASLGVDPEKQRLRLEELDRLTTAGDAERGRTIFYGKKAACSGCHAVSGQGGKVGPDLSTIGAIRTRRDLLEAVVYPSASFARDFRTYIVLTIDGKVYTGVISRETADAISLRTAELAEIRIPRKEIEEMRESPTSIMPKGLDTALSSQELADLIAWLQQRK